MSVCKQVDIKFIGKYTQCSTVDNKGRQTFSVSGQCNDWPYRNQSDCGHAVASEVDLRTLGTLAPDEASEGRRQKRGEARPQQKAPFSGRCHQNPPNFLATMDDAGAKQQIDQMVEFILQEVSFSDPFSVPLFNHSP